MKKYLIYILIALVSVAIAGGVFYFATSKNRRIGPSNNSQINSSPSDDQSMGDQPNAENQNPTQMPTIAFPLDNFSDRIAKNHFGQYFSPAGSTNPDREVCPSAIYYSGYHTASDLEILPNELEIALPVRSIASGRVREVKRVSGYGGLIIIEYSLGGRIYTAYFGHIDLETATVKAGDRVTTGEQIAELGPQCSEANGNVRKHLHFGLRKGGSVDVRGYVPTQSALSNWVDPKILLLSLKAQ